jgi:hypothetical protein
MRAADHPYQVTVGKLRIHRPAVYRDDHALALESLPLSSTYPNLGETAVHWWEKKKVFLFQAHRGCITIAAAAAVAAVTDIVGIGIFVAACCAIRRRA